MPTATKKLFLRVREANDWDKNYDSTYPFSFYLSEYEGNSESSWVIEEVEISHVFHSLTKSKIIDIQINGLKACIAESNATCHIEVTKYQQKINELLALPDLSNV